MSETIIRVLDSDTINKIAAGEVIDRPASVVKELVENAIDAGAAAVTVEASEGGKKLIRVTDNGSGIPADQVPAAFLRHATSKIRTAEDLEGVSSLGFRGEALSSIAAVSRVELITRTADSLYGLRYVIEDGREIVSQKIGAPAGTTFLVHDLFLHVPARRKFLASDQTEAAAIADIAEKIAISHPEISVRLIINGKLRFMTAGSGKLIDVIYAVLGKEIAREMLTAEADNGAVRVSGYVGKPSVSRANRGFERFCVNGRTVRSRILIEALEEGFYGHLMMHKYPVAVLNVTVDPEKLDVNVHPSKLEVRFADERAVRDCIITAVKQALAQNELITRADFGREEKPARPVYQEARKAAGYHEPFEKALLNDAGHDTVPDGQASAAASPAGASSGPGNTAVPTAGTSSGTDRFIAACGSDHDTVSGTVPLSGSASVPAPETAASAESSPDYRNASLAAERTVYTAKPQRTEGDPVHAGEPLPAAGPQRAGEMIPAAAEAEQLELPGARLLSPENRASFKLLGIAFDTYLLVQAGEDFLMIDQHAAHEKVLYERFMREFSRQEAASQLCAPPVVFAVSSAEEAVLLQNMEQFAALGFEIEPFGGRDYALRAVPANMLSLAQTDVFLELLDGMAAEGAAASRLVHDRVAKMACKAAVKGLDPLSVPEAEALIGELLSLQDPYTCPHGRPTTILMSLAEIERKFRRIVP